MNNSNQSPDFAAEVGTLKKEGFTEWILTPGDRTIKEKAATP
ncbi:MAG: hypothetical protein P2A85_24960 [Microcoleus anatoxicus]